MTVDVDYLKNLKISSSWIAGRGDVMEVGARRANGKKMKPRKKRGRPISTAVKLEQLAKVEAARERRRCGTDITRRS